MSTYYGSGLNPAIVGLTIESIELDENQERITLRFTDGTVNSYTAVGDCCSHSWIEHVTIPPNITGAVVTGIKDSNTDNFTEGYNEITVYQDSITTDKGEIILEYRNASNGYYGGWLQQSEFSSPALRREGE